MLSHHKGKFTSLDDFSCIVPNMAAAVIFLSRNRNHSKMILFLIICGLVIYYILALYCYSYSKNVNPIFGIYRQPTFWYPFKYLLFLLVYYSLRILSSECSSRKSKSSKTLTLENESIPRGLDRPQELSNHIKAFDAAFFVGVHSKGVYFMMGCERRQSDVVNGFFYLVMPELGLLYSPKLPDTVLFAAKGKQFAAEGISMTPVEPMKKWKLKYKGFMRSQEDPDQLYLVKFNAEWSSKFDCFNYDKDTHPRTVARAVAKEPWTREFFDAINSTHQSRYEQTGQANIKLDIERKTFEFTCNSLRNRSYGKFRDWSLMHRYALFHIFLENGSTAAVGVLSHPCTVSSLETGFVQEADGTFHSIEWCDLQLYQHGENGNPPRDHGFQFKAGGTVYTTQVEVLYENTHYIGWNWEAKMVERFVKYSVNGIRGRGVSEFHYRHKDGRSPSISDGDPEWFHDLRQKYVYS